MNNSLKKIQEVLVRLATLENVDLKSYLFMLSSLVEELRNGKDISSLLENLLELIYNETNMPK